MADDKSDPSLEELKERASDLDIAGRSKMDKEQLEAAIEVAESGKTTEAADEPKFNRDRLVSESRELVGHPPHVVAGALADLGGQSELTVDKAKAAVERFLSREVKED